MSCPWEPPACSWIQNDDKARQDGSGSVPHYFGCNHKATAVLRAVPPAHKEPPVIATTSRRAALAGLVAGLVAPAWRAAADGPLGEPAERVILTVSGAIRIRNRGETAVLDRPMIEALGMTSFRTQTPWYDAPSTFEGVLMTRLLARLGAHGSSVTAIALNDYRTQIPVSDFERFGTILALKRDGAYMPVRDKGPLFIVYPYDSDAELRTRQYYSRSAWQVSQLIVG